MQSGLSVKYREILGYINRKRQASVAELSNVFFLSESTVRRLLAEMDRNNLVTRFHGGAAIVGEIPPPGHFLETREVKHQAEKAAIGREAASLVRDGMTLILLGGTTVYAVCPYLVGKRLTVITTSIRVANALLHEQGIKVILLGGVVNPPELEVRGAMTTVLLERLRADILFVGATNIHPVHGLMTDDPEAIATYRECLRISDRKILLADSSKFEPGGVTVIAGLHELDCVITDEGFSTDLASSLAKQGLSISMVKPNGGG